MPTTHRPGYEATPTPLIAVDWGTTNRRIHVVEQDREPVASADSRGVTSLSGDDYAREVAAIRARVGDHPMLLGGMVGSSLGWRDAGYVDLPARLDRLAEALIWIDPRTSIVPGVAQADPADVMRGEEVQFLGAVHAGLAPADARLCQPGTHCKWARMAGGALASFTTAMTGEMFAMMRDHSLIGRDMIAPVEADAHFDEGVRAAAEGDLLAALFASRPAVLLGRRPREGVASFVSGLLIGADCRAHAGDGPVHLLADAALGSLYGAALRALGVEVVHVDSNAAFVAGMRRIWELSR
ncbi:2-dehydro-3-deoxygalactonokinase [Sphingomonas sp. ASV193]|uniref:2-dehydro-3-deoxygalactonokinase n=1 Tax=Sphingomonas sp. ASV193 TaxID=3144405 RepID=UPI0032E8E519